MKTSSKSTTYHQTKPTEQSNEQPINNQPTPINTDKPQPTSANQHQKNYSVTFYNN